MLYFLNLFHIVFLKFEFLYHLNGGKTLHYCLFLSLFTFFFLFYIVWYDMWSMNGSEMIGNMHQEIHKVESSIGLFCPDPLLSLTINKEKQRLVVAAICELCWLVSCCCLIIIDILTIFILPLRIQAENRYWGLFLKNRVDFIMEQFSFQDIFKNSG